jgi:hypothetical protein
MRRASPVAGDDRARQRPWPGFAITLRSANPGRIGRWQPARVPVQMDVFPRAPSPRAWASALRPFITGGNRGCSPLSRSYLGGPGGMR